jgi:glucose/arabinose dehydrogenase
MISASRSVRTGALPVLLAPLVFCIVLLASSAAARIPATQDIDDEDRCAALAAVQFAGPLEYPWSIAFLPDHSILVTEKPGRLQLIRPGAGPLPVARVPPVLHKGQGGLLDVAVDPAFSENGIIYLSYAHGYEELSSVRVLRAKLDQSSNTLVDQRVIFESTPSASAEQLGGRIALTDDGHLFLTVGARWQAKRAQELSEMQARSFAFAPTVRFRRITRLFRFQRRGVKSGAMATAIRKGLLSTQVADCGRTSMGHWVAMSSI